MRREAVLLDLALFLALCAPPLRAQYVLFQMMGGISYVKSGGTAEGVNAVALMAISSGTLNKNLVLSVGYSANLATGATPVVTCSAGTSCVYGTNFTVSKTSSAVIMTFLTDVNFNSGGYILFTGVHVNASGLNSGTYITATASGVFLTTSSQVTVGLVLSSPPAAPAATLSPATWTFSDQKVGTTSQAKTITLTNAGSAMMTIYGIETVGDFGETNTCGSSLAAGGNCSISVTFAPSALGSRLGMVIVSTDSVASPDGVALSGTGVTPKKRAGQVISD